MKRLLILAIIALTMLVSVNAEMDYNNSDYYAVINASGTWVLDEDINSSKWGGIWINASNVVLDGQNHQLIYSNNSEETYGVDIYSNDALIENITVKNLVIKNWDSAVYSDWSSENITIMNCEFEDNELFIDSSSIEIYFYLNTIRGEQGAYSHAPLASPKLVYNYNGNEYTYRLGNYYEGYTGTETESEGVYKGALKLFGWDGGAYDPYPLINTPENYKISKTLYPEVYDEEYGQMHALIADIFALTSDPENYVITDAPVTPTTTPRSSGGNGRSYDSDISDDIQSRIIKSFVSSAVVVYGNDIDESYAKQLRDRVHAYDDSYTYAGNVIIVGGPSVNKLAKKYNEQFEVPITNENPGENKGVIQVLKVQDNSGSIVQSHTIVYIAGSDRLGTLAAMEYFKTLEDLPTGPITVEWTENGPVLA
ncbi:hypothetical protein HNP88_000937 [Methanococcus maripaludis]|uniref:S-layer protein outer domain-containing protein n=1 Tax=Methanococcus maripaludis TaxID=39152 RepID=A0A7J9NMU2_METMI|nr:hypothetical protein [Methanococcus maripaludis]MBA2846753.1 hypothetical protein [Methanococcus maripaludis]